MVRQPSDEHPDTNPTVNTEDAKRERPPKGYAREGNYDQPRSFEPGDHDVSPNPDPGFDPRYGNNPYKGGFHGDRQGNERDHLDVTVNGEIDPEHPNTEVDPEEPSKPGTPTRH